MRSAMPMSTACAVLSCGAWESRPMTIAGGSPPDQPSAGWPALQQQLKGARSDQHLLLSPSELCIGACHATEQWTSQAQPGSLNPPFAALIVSDDTQRNAEVLKSL